MTIGINRSDSTFGWKGFENALSRKWKIFKTLKIGYVSLRHTSLTWTRHFAKTATLFQSTNQLST